MIIYAFYGMGKTTLCNKEPDIFIDADYETYKFSPHEMNYRDFVLCESKKGKVVLVNSPVDVLKDTDIAIAFIPSDIEYIAERLINRGTNKYFVENLVTYKNTILRELNECFSRKIILNKNEYISNYQGELEKMNKEAENKQVEIEQKKTQIEKLNKEIEALRNDIIAINDKELKFLEYKDMLLDALIVGADNFKVRHHEIAPYTTGFSVEHPSIKGYCAPVYCYKDWYKELPKNLYTYLTDELNWGEKQFEELKIKTDDAWGSLPLGYEPDAFEPEKNSLHGHHIANGYETDGFSEIVKGRCGGTYSSYTTSRQNDLARELIVLKGYCADGFIKGNGDNLSTPTNLPVNVIKDVYARHHLDNDFNDMKEWAKRNPSNCMDTNECFIPLSQAKSVKLRKQGAR